MPDLPNLSVTQAQLDRILPTFQGETDGAGNPLTPVQAYRRWALGNLKNRVLYAESKKIDAENEASKTQRMQAVDAEMNIGGA